MLLNAFKDKLCNFFSQVLTAQTLYLQREISSNDWKLGHLV